MLVFVIAVAAVMLPILFGLLIQSGMTRFDAVITETKAAIEEEEKAYNPAMTLGHKVRVKDTPEDQFEQARLEAAKRAAALPRGANVRIGSQGNSMLKTASDNLDDDPLTSFKIARYHGWDGAKLGIPEGGVSADGTVAPTAGVPAAKVGRLKLVPGKDYAITKVTTEMSGVEKRRARIANAKAKAAAYKAAKAAGITAESVVEAAPAAAPPPAAAPAAAAPVAAVPVGIEPPALIEITDDMPPDEKRKARVANSKAKSAYNKALKAAGIDPKSVKAGATVQVPAAEAAPVAAAPAPAAAPAASAPTGALTPEAAGIAPPEYIEITDDMPPDEKRQARVANSKARSAYNKALKAAGIDPKSLKK